MLDVSQHRSRRDGGLVPGIVLADRIATLQAEPLDRVIRRLVNREGFTEEKARRARVEFLHFMALRHVADFPLIPPKDVDHFWHAFILQTRDYAAFCQRHFGEFVHHDPQNHSNVAAANDPDPYTRTRRLLAQYFADFDTEIWPEANFCEGGCCCC